MGLKSTILANGGATIAARTLTPITTKRGYAVGATTETAIRIQTTATDKDLAQALFLIWVQYGTRHLGAWVEGDTIHLDPTTIVHSKRAAMNLGRENRQLAIYNLKTHQTITI
jgi:hypothetical protein